ncbi:VOC family protein [Planococcus lenghuensis]|uniref:Glyoxalase n=1 Tax=Planococcus lenghuensis TaxID=2213202 RepID=A0A1Q2L308_9BACL|nr:VOC family protein [Planococcus lenghuensis]AQQ54848.1 glyoxalase [Planococcus lenghuensis]
METTAIRGIGQVSVPVHNIEKAVAFYRDVLDLPLLYQAEKLAFFEIAGTRLLLNIPEDVRFSGAGSVLYFDVADIQEAYQALLDKGVAFIDEPHVVGKLGNTESWMAFFEDPEKNIHAIMSEKEA